MTIKDIIIEALNRSNLVPRKRAVPADMLENGYRLLKGIITKYNFSNFISFARDNLEIIPTDNVIELEIPSVTSISNIQYKVNDNETDELRFVAYEQFYSDNNPYTYTWKYTDQGTIQIFLKNSFLNSHRRIYVYFNKSLDYTLDEELRIPQIYIELFTAALTYNLAITYPRTDANQVSLLKTELDNIEKEIKSLISSNKILTRNSHSGSYLDSFMSGSFIFR